LANGVSVCFSSVRTAKSQRFGYNFGIMFSKLFLKKRYLW
jgi:hypothetical protein